MIHCLRVLKIASLLACLVLPAKSYAVTNLASIDTLLDKDASLPLSNQISLEINSSQPYKLSQTFNFYKNIDVLNINDNTIAVTIDLETINRTSPAKRHLNESFIVDINEPSTQTFINGFGHPLKSTITTEDLIKYVSGYIENPTYIHGFNIASLVAKQKSGDCTEFAVLTTALARSLGIPARIIFGSTLIEENNSIFGTGHAWSEIWLNNQWVIADAALYNHKKSKIFYIPSSEITNESPGFTFSLLNIIKHHPLKFLKVRSLKIQ